MKYLTPKEYGTISGLSFFTTLLLSILRALFGSPIGIIESGIVFLILCIVFYYYILELKNDKEKDDTQNT